MASSPTGIRATTLSFVVSTTLTRPHAGCRDGQRWAPDPDGSDNVPATRTYLPKLTIGPGWPATSTPSPAGALWFLPVARLITPPAPLSSGKVACSEAAWLTSGEPAGRKRETGSAFP